IGTDQGMDLAGFDREARVRHGADAAELFRDGVHEQEAASALRQEKRWRRQAIVSLAPAHRGRFFRRRAPAPFELRPDADQPTRRVENEGYEDQPEPEKPVR